MTDAERDAWLSEMWSYCRELPHHEREEKRKSDRRIQREVEDRVVINTLSPAAVVNVDSQSTGCSETGRPESAKGAA